MQGSWKAEYLETNGARKNVFSYTGDLPACVCAQHLERSQKKAGDAWDWSPSKWLATIWVLGMEPAPL